MSNQETDVGTNNQAEWLWCRPFGWGPAGDCNHQTWWLSDWYRKNPDYDTELASYWPCANMKNLQGRGEGGRMDNVDPSVYTPVKEVEAAILSMKHTFQTDNLVCGRLMTN